MSKVVLKGEFHSSKGDLKEEKELVKQDFDVLVLEGQETESDYSLTEGWFQISIAAMFWLAGRIYVSKDILLDLVEVQDTEVMFTRKADSDLLENTPLSMKLSSAILFYTLVPGSVAVGLIFPKMWGATILFLGFVLPVLGIRIVNTRLTRGEKNRDKIMAGKIADAVNEDKDVLAIVGNDHVNGIVENLPNSIDLNVRRPAYARLDRQHIQEIAFPIFEMVLVLYSLYLLVSWSLLQVTRISPALF